MAHDVTEQMRAEAALRKSEERFRSLAGLSSDWYWEQDAELRFSSVSEGFFQKSGMLPEDVLGRHRWELSGASPPGGSWDAHRAALEARLPFRDFEFARVAADGTTHYQTISGEPVFDAEGRFTGYRGTGRDITERRCAERNMRDSEERHRVLFEASPMQMYVYDRKTLRILAANERMVEQYGWSREELQAMSMLELRPPEQRAKVELVARGEIDAGTRHWRHWRRSGEEFDVEVTAHDIAFDGRIARLITVNDITERKNAERTLRENRRLLARAQEIAGLGYWEYDLAAGVARGSRELRRMLGIPGDVPAQTLEWGLNMIHPDDRERVRTVIKRSVEAGSSYEFETRLVTLGGTVRIMLMSGEAVGDDAGRITKLIGTCLDITEQRRREEELCNAAEELQVLSRRLVDAQETERRRLAAELHDRVGQNLTALSINLDILAGRMTAPDADARRRLRDSLALLDATALSIEGVLDDLRPPMLDDWGLGPTLRWVGDEFSRRSEIPVRVQVLGTERRIDSQTETALLRIVQEALNNVAKHAGARQVEITLGWEQDAVRVEVADDGAGFEHTEFRGGKGLGIVTMRERVQAANGRLNIDSAPGNGTRVRALIPR